MRIVSFNIRNGGEGALEDVFNVIADLNPDICAILEAVSWQDKEQELKDMAQKNGYVFFNIFLANSKYNIAILSKKNLEVEQIKSGFRHTAIKASIKDGPHEGLNIYFTHLSPVSEQDRLIEAKILICLIGKDEKAIVAGDLNSLSSKDDYDRVEVLRILKQKNIKKFGEEELLFDVISSFEDNDFVDSFLFFTKEFDFSTPTKSNTDPYHALPFRLDYFLVKNKLMDQIKFSGIFKSNIADSASDHYPIFLDLK